MAISVQVQRVQKITAGGNGATQDVTFSFTPKAIMVVSDGSTADNTFSNNYQWIQGFSDGTNHACVAIWQADNDSRSVGSGSNAGRIHRNNAVFTRISGGADTNPSENSRASCSFSTNKVTLTWDLLDATATYLTIIAFGGTDITNAKVATPTVGTTSTGTRDYTGLGFDVTGPNGILFTICADLTSANSATRGGSITHGAAVSSTQRYTLGNNAEPTASNIAFDINRYISNVRCLLNIDDASSATDMLADFDSWITDGFRLDIEDAPSSSSLLFSYLVINGGTWDAGSDTTKTSTGTDTTTVSVSSNTIRGIGTAMTGSAFSGGVVNEARVGQGFSDTTNESWFGAADTGTTSAATACRNSANDRLLAVSNAANTTASSTTFLIDADFSSVGTNVFTLNYNTANASAQDFVWWVVADSSGGLTQVSQSKTHKYDVIGKVSRSKTHKWNIIAVVTKSKTHKFNIFKIVSLTRTHKYNILQKITQTKTHKYNIIGKITATKTHKYNIIGKITQTKTHKYNILEKVTSTKTHLYNIIGKITVTKTHKYSLLNTVSQSKTHKFSILTSLSLSKTHKYNILEQVVKAAVHVYNVIGLVTTTKTHKYDLEGKVVTTKTHKYNILQSVSASKTHEYNILNAATTTKTHLFSILEAAATTTTHLYNIIGYITKTKTHIYDVIGKISTTKTHKYDVIATITKSTTHKYNIISAIAAVSKTHKYNIESDTTVSATKTHKFNILQKVTKSKTHIYNVVETVSTIKTHVFNILEQITAPKTHKFNVIQEIEAQKTHVFSVLERLSVSKTHIFNILEAVTLTKTHKYNIIGKVTATKTHVYDVDSAIFAVSTTKTHKYDINAATTPVSTTKTHIFDILQRISTLKTHEYNILQGAVKTKTHKFNIITQITRTKTHKFNIIAKLTVTKSHIYNILQKITTVTKTHRYNIVNLVGPRTRTHKYNVIGRITTTKTHKYGLGGKVVSQKSHRYQLGAIVFRELGGSTHALIRFPERVTVIDILGDINNKVVANIEISPIHQQKNIVTAVVQISEYPFNILTAETHKPRHRIASSLILPPIIDTIENRVVAPYIGIQSIESTPESQIRLKSALRLEKTPNPSFYVTSKTQIRQDEKTIIKVSGALSLKDKDRVVSTASIMISPNLQLNKIVIPEIMSLETEQTIKTLIHLLKSDEIFE